MRSITLLATLLIPLGACNLYFGNSDECDFATNDPDFTAAPLELRNPFSGQCESFGSGPYPCDSAGSCGCDEPDYGGGRRPDEELLDRLARHVA